MEDKFQYFMEESNKRFDKIDDKLEELISFRVMLLGASIAVSSIFAIVINIITIWVRA